MFVFMSARFIMEPCQCAERVSLKLWRAIFIIESINKVCFDLLHKINLISMIVDLFFFFFRFNWFDVFLISILISILIISLQSMKIIKTNEKNLWCRVRIVYLSLCSIRKTFQRPQTVHVNVRWRDNSCFVYWEIPLIDL